MNRKWTSKRIARLATMRDSGLSYGEIGKVLDASEASIRAAVKRHLIGRPDETPEAQHERNLRRRGQLREWERRNKDKRFGRSVSPSRRGEKTNEIR